jgi:hypothetical protein
MKLIDIDKIAHILAPYQFDTLISVKGIDGPGNWLIEFFTKGDQYIALVNDDGFVVWCYSTANRDRGGHALELIWQYENAPHLNLAAMDMDELARKRGMARLHDPELGPTDGHLVFVAILDRMLQDLARRDPEALQRLQWAVNRLPPAKPAATDYTSKADETRYVAENARAALGAAAALGGSNLPAKAPEPLEEPGKGSTGHLPAITRASAVAEVADMLHCEQSEGEEVNIRAVEAYFQDRGGSVTLMTRGDEVYGFRLWLKNQYIGKWEGGNGNIDIAWVRDADKALTELQVHV